MKYSYEQATNDLNKLESDMQSQSFLASQDPCIDYQPPVLDLTWISVCGFQARCADTDWPGKDKINHELELREQAGEPLADLVSWWRAFRYGNAEQREQLIEKLGVVDIDYRFLSNGAQKINVIHPDQ